ncbi:deoxyguanosinetriphosphate triphosphohydrolase family protein [Deinococcus sedimenti]|uniref:Deoxyguanosinetriphosphate triphosphohydrolase-like protein n=1 Tax=Deinococcus sedimenti TaxID=1867090 RepID=A0ABQ2RZQ7_9DEIO|nr:dNTP triphosphohydrolase [Deinococcus sedimenti]GGR84277.1 deoxyguanosinetriphosphate triphosphohydrolase-like protein [Deinococcus sedimenti]
MNDPRTPEQHDRDRVLHTDEFRRLAGITQVITPTGHSFHNRLTHSLEVAQIARRLSENLAAQAPEKHRGAINPDVVETAALIHDLGHPPFGHVGEEMLDALGQAAGLEDGFEGNAQSFRIATRIAVHKASYLGLGLTRATLNASLKYPNLRGPKPPQGRDDKRAKKLYKKFGAYTDDAEAFAFARELSADDSPSIEAQIMDYADDIAYSMHDLVDFYRAGIIPIADLVDNLNQFFDAHKEHFLPSEYEHKEDEALEIVRRIFDMMPRSMFRGDHEAKARLRDFMSAHITAYSQLSIDWNQPTPQLIISAEHRLELAFLKRIIWEYVILRQQLASQQAGHRRIITVLFDTYLDAVEQAAKKGSHSLIPPGFAHEACLGESPAEGVPHHPAHVRLAIDIVSSLSDAQAQAIYLRVTGINPGQITDNIFY